MKVSERINYIKDWIITYCNSMKNTPSTLVIGVSGGIDSSLTSTICAMTKKKIIVVSMPIRQDSKQHDLSIAHQDWLMNNFENVECRVISLDLIFKNFKETLNEFNSDRGLANSRSRLRMVTLYQIAQSSNGLVVGTGNKIEDFGVGFYTKYGDGGVDISPIADCNKSQVWEMGKNLGILKEIIDAQPTDGLWDDGRTDVNQLGMSYQELEKAMKDPSNKNHKKYLEIRKRNLHKMNPIPVCKMKDE